MADKYAYSVEREIFTYVELFTTARDSLRRAKENEERSFYPVMASLVFSAFAFEAYLNHLGAEKFKFWGEIERVSAESKLKIIAGELKVEVEKSKRPWQTLFEVQRFRNLMAHGRTERIEGSGTVDDPEVKGSIDLVEAKWEEFCREENAERALADVEEIIVLLHEAAGEGKHPFLLASSGEYSMSLTPNE